MSECKQDERTLCAELARSTPEQRVIVASLVNALLMGVQIGAQSGKDAGKNAEETA